jgi:hypothetical protein
MDAGSSGGGDLAGAPKDMASAPKDMATAPVGDMATPPGADMAVACNTVQSTAGLSDPSGHHNAGLDCQGCHGPGGGAPTFYVGGTLYNSVNGAAPVAGATINVTDANGQKLKIVTATNGNFWTSTAVAYPITVNASLCPNTLAMSASVSGNGACNNCHNSTFRVHVP